MIGIYLLAGILLGLLATLFGFGGGFVVVPLLFWVLPYYNVSSDLAMHMAIGTSLMLMFINMTYATWLHYRKQNIDFILVKKMLPLIIVGALLGSIIASLLDGEHLKEAFILLLLFVLLSNIKQEFFRKKIMVPKKPSPILLKLVSFITGIIAALLGIGGSVIIVPFFRQFNLPMNKSAALANALAVPSGLIGSIIFIVAGLNTPNLPAYSTGYLYWPALLCIFFASIFGSKLGIHLSTLIPDNIYGKIYCLLLVIVILSMVVN